MNKWIAPESISAIAAIAGLGGLLFGFDTGIIADVQHVVVSQYDLSMMQWSLIVSITVIAAFVGALCSAKLADLFGRRASLLAVGIGFVVATLVLTCATGFVSLFIGRFLIGLCIGVASYITPLYIAELAPRQYRGKLVLFNSIAITVGECLAFLCGYLVIDFHEQAWRLVFLIGVIPAVLLIIGMQTMPRSPRWLAMKGFHQESKSILTQLRGYASMRQEWKEIELSLKNSVNQIGFKRLWDKPIRPVLILGIGLGILQQFAGINTVMYYGPHIFMTSGVVNATAIGATFILGLINALATVLVVMVVDKVGRRNLLIWGSLAAACCLSYLALNFDKATGVVILFIMMAYIFFYAISLGSMFWLLIAEIYPINARGMAMSVVTAIQWVANFVIAISFLPLQQYLPHPGDVFFVFSLMCFIAFIISWLFVPETTGVSLESIEEKVISGHKLRCIGKVRT